MAITHDKQGNELFDQGSIRERLTADRAYWVDPGGSDSNDGLSTITPFATIQKAIDTIAALDANGYKVTANVRNGTYTEDIRLRDVVGLQGDASNPSSIQSPDARIIGFGGVPASNIINGTITGSACSTVWQLSGFRLRNASGSAIEVGHSAPIKVQDVEFEWTGTTGIAIDLTNSFCLLDNSIEHIGRCTTIFKANNKGSFATANLTFNFATGSTFSNLIQLDNGSFYSVGGGTSYGVTGALSGVGGQVLWQVRVASIIEDLNEEISIANIPGAVLGTRDANSAYNNCFLGTEVNVETLTGDKTLLDGHDSLHQILDPGGANRDIDLPTSGVLLTQQYIVINPAGSGFDLVLKESAVTLSTITPGTKAEVLYDGADWIVI